MLPHNPWANFTLPIQQIRKAGWAWLSELPIQLSRDLLSSFSMPGAQRDRERSGSWESRVSKEGCGPAITPTKVIWGLFHPICKPWVGGEWRQYVCLGREIRALGPEIGIKTAWQETSDLPAYERNSRAWKGAWNPRPPHFLTVTALTNCLQDPRLSVTQLLLRTFDKWIGFSKGGGGGLFTENGTSITESSLAYLPGILQQLLMTPATPCSWWVA